MNRASGDGFPPIDFSIIVPTFQRPEGLRRCLAALSRMDYPADRYEVIVVDDGSDPPVEPLVCEAVGAATCRFIRQENHGPGLARNAGAAQARGRWLAFTDDDCAPRSDWLRVFAAVFRTEPTALLGGHTVNALRDNVYAQASQDLIDYLYGYFNAAPGRARLFTSNNMAAPRETFLEIGGFNPRFGLVGSEDRELCDHWREAGCPLVPVAEAVVDHAHDMDLGGYCRQHFTYGQGAPSYHRLRVKRGRHEHKGRTPEPLSFYTRLVCSPLRNDGLLSFRGWRGAALMVLSQVAYITGALTTVLGGRSGPSPKPNAAAQWLAEGRRPWLIAGLLGALFGALVWLQRVPLLTVRNDDLVYILMSREVARFSYAQTWLVGAPFHTHYPPGFPSWLATLSGTFGEHMSVFVLGNIVLMIGTLMVLFDAVRRLWSAPMALLMLAIVVANPLTQHVSASVLSEALYLFCVSLAVWAVAVMPARTSCVVMAGASAIAATLTRSIGLALLGALAVWWLQERRWRALGALVIASGLTVGVWHVWATLAPGQVSGSNYVTEGVVRVLGDQSSDPIIVHVAGQAWEYWSRSVPVALSLPHIRGTVIDNLFWLGLLTGLTALGLARLWSVWRMVFWYLIAYAAILVLWPWGNQRMLMPMVPFLVVTFLASVDWARGSRFMAPVAVAIAIMAGGMLGGGISETTLHMRSRLACDRSMLLESPACFNPDERGLLVGALWLATNVSPDDAVLSFKEAAAAYYSEHRIVRPSNDEYRSWSEAPDLLKQIRTTGARYIFLDHIHPYSRGLGRTLAPWCDRMVLVQTFSPVTLLFDIHPEATAASSDACPALHDFVETPKQQRWIW